MIRFADLTLARAGKPLFSGASLLVSPGERIALIGANGSGKSSLIALLRGELTPESGSVTMSPMRIGWLSQQVPQSDATAVRFVMDADPALVAAEAKVAATERDADGERIGAAYDDWLEAGGASAQARASELLSGLGFSEALMGRPVAQLSGGWKMRLNLACVLMAPADLLLLDEPTNHLDLDAVLWLERQLARHPATQLIVSHDRDFLDRVVGACLSIEDGELKRYSGGYSACEAIRAEHAAQRERQRRVQQARIAHLTSFVERFRAKATKARQAQSRLKALERIETLAPLRASRGIDFAFEDPPPGPDPLIDVRHLDCGYPADGAAPSIVVRIPELTVRRGARIGILGRNGSGKTTLIRTLLGELAPIGGELVRAPNMKVGYLAQQHIDDLRDADSALTHLARIAPAEREQTLRGWLGQFGFGGDDAMRPVGPMSGGEKARLGLALLAWRRPAFLVLDEPTNHLDASTRDALADALAEFEGALLLVSHDRYLLRATVDEFRLVDDGRLVPFDGDLDDYATWLLQSRREGARADAAAARPMADAAPAARPTAAAVAGARPAKQPDAVPRQSGPASPTPAAAGDDRRERARRRGELAARLKPVEARVRRIDALLARHQQRAVELDRRLSEADAYRDPEAAAEAARERAWLAGQIAELEESWLAEQTEIDALKAAAGDA